MLLALFPSYACAPSRWCMRCISHACQLTSTCPRIHDRSREQERKGLSDRERIERERNREQDYARNRKRGAQVGRSIDPTKGGRYLRKSERDDLLRQRATREAEREERRRGKKSRSRDRLRDKGREWSRGRI
jgi:hypothetical protein